MTIFDILNSILFSKKTIDINVEDDQNFNLFMVNRWCSMHSKEIATIINHTTNNVLGGVLNSKQEQYTFLYKLLPRVKFKRLNYLKKNKVDKKTEDSEDNLKILAKNKEISTRELKEYKKLMKTIG